MITSALLVGALLASPPCATIVNGQVFLPAPAGGRFAPGTLTLVGERIVEAAPPNAACDRLDASGGVVTPGLIEANTQLGLTGIDGEALTNNATPKAGLRASYRVADGYDPLASSIPVTRLGGITAALVVPTGRFVSGQAALVRLWGRHQSEAVLEPFAGLATDLRGSQGPHPTALLRLSRAFEEARWFSTHRDEWERTRTPQLGHAADDLDVLARVAAGDKPLLVAVERAADIEAVLRLRDTPQLAKLRLVLVGASEAWLLADRLAAAQVPVVVDPLLNGPNTLETRYAREDNAALLLRAGVQVVLSSFSNHNARTLRHVAGNAVRAGLTRAEALDAITRTPAAVFGLAGRGTLAPGSFADVVVWDGDPLEVTSAPLAVFVEGRRIPLESRQSALRERYRPKAPMPASANGAASP